MMRIIKSLVFIGCVLFVFGVPHNAAAVWAPGSKVISNSDNPIDERKSFERDFQLPKPISWTVGPWELFKLNTSGGWDIGYSYLFKYDYGEGIDVAADNQSNPQLITRTDLEAGASAWLNITLPGVEIKLYDLQPVKFSFGDLVNLLTGSNLSDLAIDVDLLREINLRLPFHADGALYSTSFGTGIYANDYSQLLTFDLTRVLSNFWGGPAAASVINKITSFDLGVATGFDGELAFGLNNISYDINGSHAGFQRTADAGVDVSEYAGQDINVTKRDYAFRIEPTIGAGVALYAGLNIFGVALQTYYPEKGSNAPALIRGGITTTLNLPSLSVPFMRTYTVPSAANRVSISKYTITITKPTHGKVISTPAGINCGNEANECSVRFAGQTPLTLSALADSGYGVNRWGGDICVQDHDDTRYGDTQCTFTVNTDENISITFRDNERPVIAAPQPIVVTLAPETETVNIQLSSPDVSDNVDTNIAVAPYRATVSSNNGIRYEATAYSQSFTAGEYEIVWRAEDSAGNIGEVSQFITVNEFTQIVEDEHPAVEFNFTNDVYLIPEEDYASRTNRRIDLDVYLRAIDGTNITRYCSFSFLRNTNLASIDDDQIVAEDDKSAFTPPIQANCRYKGKDYRAEWPAGVLIWTPNTCEHDKLELLQNGDFSSNGSSWTTTGGFRADAAYRKFSNFQTDPGYAYLAAEPNGSRGTNLSGSIYQQEITIDDRNEDIQEVELSYWYRISNPSNNQNNKLEMRYHHNYSPLVPSPIIRPLAFHYRNNFSYQQYKTNLNFGRGRRATGAIIFNGATDSEDAATLRVDSVKITATKISRVTERVLIDGPITAKENSRTTYKLLALTCDGTEENVTRDARWTITRGSNIAEISDSGSRSGRLTTESVSQDTTITIQASYGEHRDDREVTIQDIPRLFEDVEISGERRVNENGTYQYTAEAVYSDDTSELVSGGTWSTNASQLVAAINQNGDLTVKSVNADTNINIRFEYEKDGDTYDDVKNISIRNILVSPSKVTSIQASIDDARKIYINWAPGNNDTEYYKLYRSTDGDINESQDLFVSNWATSDYDDTGTIPELNYFYAVQACNGAGCGELSEIVKGIRAPQDPLDLEFTPNTAGTSLFDFVQISSGNDHTCAVLTDDTAQCWGSNRQSQLGNSTEDDSAFPVTVPNLNNAVSISAGDDHTCAVLTDGTAQCWGSNSGGQLGNGTRDYSAVPVTVLNLSNVTSISAEGSHTCAVLTDGTAQCWGSNRYGQLGNGTTDNSAVPVTVPNLSNVTSISAGYGHTCAVLTDGMAQCWGWNYYGHLGNGTTNRSTVPVAVPNLSNVASISAGQSHTCAVLTDGTAQCWGGNWYGQLGNGTTDNSAVPVAVSDLNNAAFISVGQSHTCAMLTDGTAQCWGRNWNGQLGIGTRDDSVVPVTVSNLSNVVSISAGWRHTCTILTDGTAQCWGSNSSNQLGNGITDGSAVPIAVSNLSNVVSISVGWRHTCTILTDGMAQCWGSNSRGQLGNGTTDYSAVPVTVSNLNNAASISVEYDYTCAALTDGTVQCWGSNRYGQLGNGTTDNSTVPVTIPNLINVTSISAGRISSFREHNTCAVLTDGTVQCWGDNDNGQLGNGMTDDSIVPITVPNLSNVTSISVGIHHTCAILTDGTARCWGGNNFYGQLGKGSVDNPAVPVAVSRLSNAASISVGSSHTCAVLTDGTAQCWGSNRYGQSGNESGNGRTHSASPANVSNLNNAASISAGDDHTCAVLTNGMAKCWGRNRDGQLGNGTTDNSAVPLTVFNLSNVTSISAGNNHTCAVSINGIAWCWGSDSYSRTLGFPDTDTPAPVIASGDSRDWTLTDLSVNDTYFPGQITTLTATAYSVGTAATLGTAMRFYLTDTLPINIYADTVLCTVAVNPLLSGASFTADANCQIPTDIPEGVYYISACLDALVSEVDRYNNCSPGTAVTIQHIFDWTVSSLSVSDLTPQVGQAISIEATVLNLGSTTITDTAIRYYLSPDNTIDANDLELCTDSVAGQPAGGTSLEITDCTIPADVIAGNTYYLGACVDPVSEEISESNNCYDGFETIELVIVKLQSIAAIPSSPTEGDDIRLTITLDTPVISSVVASIVKSGGDATLGQDYAVLPETIIFEAGTTQSTVLINTLDDEIDELAETIVLEIRPQNTLKLSGNLSITLEIIDNDIPELEVIAFSTLQPVEGENIIAELRLDRAPVQNVIVSINQVGGNATFGIDYTAMPSTVAFVKDQRQITFPIKTLDDEQINPFDRVLILEIASQDNELDNVLAATLRIQDDDIPRVRFLSSEGTVFENSTHQVVIEARPAPITTPITVQFESTSSTPLGAGYSLSPTSVVTFQPGQSTASISLTVHDDNDLEPIETITISAVSASAPAILAEPSSTTIRVKDDDVPIVRIKADTALLQEGSSRSITVALDKPFRDTVTIMIATEGQATDTVDYSLTPTEVTLLSGQTTATVILSVIEDSENEPPESIILSPEPDSLLIIADEDDSKISFIIKGEIIRFRIKVFLEGAQ